MRFYVCSKYMYIIALMFVSRLKFDSAEECGKWYDRLKENCVAPSRLENFFAFAYFVWCQDAVPDSPSSDGGDLHCFQPRGNKTD